MGLAKGIFVVDTHTHAQRHAYGVQREEAKSEFSALSGGMSRSSVYDNTPRMLYHMDRYGVDVAVVMPAFGMTNASSAAAVMPKCSRKRSRLTTWATPSVQPCRAAPSADMSISPRRSSRAGWPR